MRRRGVRCSVLAILYAIFFLPVAAFAQESPHAASAMQYPEGLVHTVVQGDTLWDLSAKYLGSAWLWPELWERNRFLTNPPYISPGIGVTAFPPPPREYVWEIREPAPAPQAEPAVTAAPPSPAGPPPFGKEWQGPTLSVTPDEFVRAGGFT